MKIPLTFLLSLTFLFLFSGSVYGDEPETNLKDKTFNQTSLAPEKTYKRNPYFPFYTKGWHILISGLSEQKYGWYFYVPILLLVYWMGRTKAPYRTLVLLKIYCIIVSSTPSDLILNKVSNMII